MEITRLKSGIDEASVLVAGTKLSLSGLMKSNPIAFYEVVMLARDISHELFGNTSDILKNRGLLQSDDTLHSSIRNIILDSVKGNGLEMVLV